MHDKALHVWRQLFGYYPLVFESVQEVARLQQSFLRNSSPDPSHLRQKSPRAGFNYLTILIGVHHHVYARPRADFDNIRTQVEDVSHQLKSYVINESIAKVTSATKKLVKMPNKSVVQFADTVRFKAVRFGNAYPNEWIEKVKEAQLFKVREHFSWNISLNYDKCRNHCKCVEKHSTIGLQTHAREVKL